MPLTAIEMSALPVDRLGCFAVKQSGFGQDWCYTLGEQVKYH
jgi:hypothetical protein